MKRSLLAFAALAVAYTSVAPALALNPQPLPPRWSHYKFKFKSPYIKYYLKYKLRHNNDAVKLNPQPLPPLEKPILR